MTAVGQHVAVIGTTRGQYPGAIDVGDAQIGCKLQCLVHRQAGLAQVFAGGFKVVVPILGDACPCTSQMRPCRRIARVKLYGAGERLIGLVAEAVVPFDLQALQIGVVSLDVAAGRAVVLLRGRLGRQQFHLQRAGNGMRDLIL